MACTSYTLSGLNVGCKDSLGGIKEVYIAPYDEINLVTVTDGKISAISANEHFKTFKFRKNTGSMTSTLQVSENGGNSVQTELTLQFMKMETAKRVQMMALFMTECAAIVLDTNGKYWYLGYDYPIEASSGTAQTGTNLSDLNGYDITLTDTSRELPYEVNADVIANIIEAAPVSA